MGKLIYIENGKTIIRNVPYIQYQDRFGRVSKKMAFDGWRDSAERSDPAGDVCCIASESVVHVAGYGQRRSGPF